MGAAAYQRGNAVIRRQIEADMSARPQSIKGFERDSAMRAVLRAAEEHLERMWARVRMARAQRRIEQRRAALTLEAIERTYTEARAAGLTADDRGMYWLALARHRARRVDPSA